MSFWHRLLERLDAIRMDFESWFRAAEPTSTVDFSIAFISLAAKLAKADGRVSISEVEMFRRIMEIPADEEENVAHVYNLCREQAEGYRKYAKTIRKLIRGRKNEQEIRNNLIDGLFHIALADGEYHPNEDRFIREVAAILEVSERSFEHFRTRHVPDAWCAYRVLEVDSGSSPDEVRMAWRRLVKQNHPDLLVSKGLPPEMIQIAESRLKDINRAFNELIHS